MTAAATALHLSQPRISVHVAALEAVVGAPLFERGARGVTLTPLGARFVPRARRVFDEPRSAADESPAPLWRHDVQVVHATDAASPPVEAFLRLLHEHGPTLTR